VAEFSQRVPQALSLDPTATLFSTALAAHSSPLTDPSIPPIPPIPPLPRRRRSTRHAAYGRRLGLALFMGLSGALAFSLLTDGGKHTRAVASFLPDLEQVLQWTGLRIEQVALSGQRFTADSDVFAAIDLPSTGSLATFNAGGARERIEKLPWVSTAAISRIYPGSLDVRITERRPSALWINGGREYLVDGSGRVLSGLKPGTNVRLPRLSGVGAPEQAQALLELIVRFPRVAERFEMAERIGGRRWTLHLKGGVVVHLGPDREAVAFAALSSPDELGKLLNAQNVVVDLRARGRISVRPAARNASSSATQS
jgi:cell division protein FtsQ